MNVLIAALRILAPLSFVAGLIAFGSWLYRDDPLLAVACLAAGGIAFVLLQSMAEGLAVLARLDEFIDSERQRYSARAPSAPPRLPH